MIVSSSGLATAEEIINYYTNSIGMKFIMLPPGTFMMGAGKNVEDPTEGELPYHQVRISKPFYLGIYEVTQAQWKAVMGNNPSEYKNNDNPVEMVNWPDVQAFIKRLNKKEGHSRYRLPTEAEWERAVRAGTTSTFYFGIDESQLLNHAWYKDNSGDTTHPVGQKLQNAWGLYDILGNVLEMTDDWYGEAYYVNSPSVDPTGPISGDTRVVRGCGWNFDARYCRSADRLKYTTDYRNEYYGFRLALSPEGTQ
jgi:formylglycine-generating enzyme required for sulfatase activity